MNTGRNEQLLEDKNNSQSRQTGSGRLSDSSSSSSSADAQSEKKRDGFASAPQELALIKTPKLNDDLMSGLRYVFARSFVTNHLIEFLLPYISLADDIKTQAVLARTCKPLNTFFKPFIEKEKQVRLTKLLSHVVKGELKEVKDMLEVPANRSLLLYSARVKTYSHGDMEAKSKDEIEYQEMEGTAYRLALAAKDVAIKREEGMVEVIQSYLKQLPNGEAEIKKQQDDQFPQGWEAEQKKREEADLAALNKVFAAIKKSETNYDKELKDEIHQFRKHVKESNRLITSGYQFNDQLLVEAFRLYVDIFDTFYRKGTRQIHFAWYQIVGYVERFMPANYVPTFYQGILDTMGFDDMPPRSHILHFGKLLPRMGNDLALGMRFQYPAGQALGTLCCVREFCYKKISAVQTIMWPDRQAKSYCLIL